MNVKNNQLAIVTNLFATVESLNETENKLTRKNLIYLCVSICLLLLSFRTIGNELLAGCCWWMPGSHIYPDVFMHLCR